MTNAKISKGKKVGLVGWKMFTSEEDNYQIQDLPAFIVSSIVELVGEDAVSNRTDLFIHSDYGVRSLNTANEVAYYEFGSSLASDCVMNAIDEGGRKNKWKLVTIVSTANQIMSFQLLQLGTV
ncbi:MAG: hypothetical protein ACLSDG_06160 [Streptococcus thermophilus]